VHRDIKPDNILVAEDGRVKVSDFGLARMAAPVEAAVTTAGRVLGTPAYMSPEALAGAAPDPRMDLFSLGVVLHEMLTGRRPAGEAAPLPEGLDRVVRRATAAEAHRRYASAAEMRADLLAPRPADAGDALPAEERTWLRSVALVQTLATAAALWAFLVSITPRVLRPGDEQPLIMLGTERLADGRTVSRARFETWPTLGAVALVGVALASQALLRRHWRTEAVARSAPARPVPESRTVLVLGLASLALYVIRRGLERAGVHALAPYVPIVGGLIELAAVFYAWVAVLEAARTQRPLRAETALWIGILLTLVAPVTELGRYIQAWRP
jgi:serine/threonine-protein kinase